MLFFRALFRELVLLSANSTPQHTISFLQTQTRSCTICSKQMCPTKIGPDQEVISFKEMLHQLFNLCWNWTRCVWNWNLRRHSFNSNRLPPYPLNCRLPPNPPNCQHLKYEIRERDSHLAPIFSVRKRRLFPQQYKLHWHNKIFSSIICHNFMGEYNLPYSTFSTKVTDLESAYHLE